MNFKKLIVGLSTAGLMLSILAGPALATSHETEGSVTYDAYSLTRHAKFEVEQEGKKACQGWNVQNNWVFTFEYPAGSFYPHDATLTQNGNDVSGTGGYPAGGPYSYTWHVTSGGVSANTLSLTIVYDTGTPGTVMHMTGTIAPNGTVSGVWDDNFGGTRNGTWSSTSGSANFSIVGCKAEGFFEYSDKNHDSYKVKVKYVNFSGKTAYFAGQVTKASNPAWVGNWLFAKVFDGGPPKGFGDQIWGSFVSEATAKMGVVSMADPGDGPFSVSGGNISVH